MSTPPTLDAATQTAIVHSLAEQLRAYYIFPEVAEQIGARLEQSLRQGDYAALTEGEPFAQALTEHMQAVNQDKHLRVFWSPTPLPPAGGPQQPSPEQLALWQQQMALDNYGLHKVERLPGNVGYMDIRAFCAPQWGGAVAVAALNFLANASALIVDLRRCRGGDPSMIALVSSYLFEGEPVHLNSFYWRTGTPQQYWTLPYVPGQHFGGTKPIYVLTSVETFSGGEEFAYNLQTRQRATLIGETTGGGAHPGDVYRLHPHFEAFIPNGRAVNPITNTNWEGTGVTPDIAVAQAQALEPAYRLALQAVIAGLGEAASGPLAQLKAEAQAALQGLG